VTKEVVETARESHHWAELIEDLEPSVDQARLSYLTNLRFLQTHSTCLNTHMRDCSKRRKRSRGNSAGDRKAASNQAIGGLLGLKNVDVHTTL
jgi:hypothetical protein